MQLTCGENNKRENTNSDDGKPIRSRPQESLSPARSDRSGAKNMSQNQVVHAIDMRREQQAGEYKQRRWQTDTIPSSRISFSGSVRSEWRQKHESEPSSSCN